MMLEIVDKNVSKVTTLGRYLYDLRPQSGVLSTI